ncbi:hypothetical protein PT974_09095 [Cladobotryum mycophilum]|uniref:Uncharacterized protein n=1 Tax=Cladobotryum mycophilum TaxID=491253 RepID=A0ABR0SF68_9HYPO
MPPPLDLSHSAHAKVIVAPPRINLRRAASYNNHERYAGPLSSTSSRFNFNHLFFSPPPSPSLPALLPRPKKSPTRIIASRPSRVLRYLVYLTALLLTSYLLGYVFRNRDSIIAIWPQFANDDGFEMVGQDAIPDFPTPIVASHGHTKSKWTIAIPHDRDFPLSIAEYEGMGSRCREVSAHARELHGKGPLSDSDKMNHDASDPYFVDVDEAEKAGLLPTVGKANPAKKTGNFVGLNWESMAGLPVCKTSLTYVLESPDAGLGPAIMNMWMLYGIAKQQKRAFFIDDSRWAYGAYTGIFQPPPLPNCRPPPRHQMVPCPAQAKHLVVSSVTLRDVLPALMTKHHRATGAKNDLHDLFELARTGYKALFLINKEDKGYIGNRIKELKEKSKAADAPIIGLHIRHGDQHPLEYQYQSTYMPSEVFLNKAQYLADAYYNATGKESATNKAITIIASDDPMVHKQPEFVGALRAQERILLSSKEPAKEVKLDPRVLHQFKEEEFGWEGGFFGSMFWNLGSSHKNNANNAPSGGKKTNGGSGREAPSELTLKLRSYVGRAYMIDLAVLAGASDHAVCAVSAMGCRMLAVMMGWEAGIQKGGWVNIDGDYQWGWMNW